MGATIYPAQRKEIKIDGVWTYMLDSVIDAEYFQVEDPDFGTVSIGNPWEMHLSYSTVSRLFSLLDLHTERDQYAAQYSLTDVCGRLEALMEHEHWGQLTSRDQDLMDGLLRICFYGLRNGAELIAWS